MNQAVIIDAVRTPIGRSHPQKGVFRQVRGDELAIACVQALVARSALDPALIDDVVLGCAHPCGEQSLNVARIVALAAGLDYRVPGVTVNRLCGSGMQALHQAVHAIQAGAQDVQIVGGFEHMQRVAIGPSVDLPPALQQRTSQAALNMGLTAELLARKYAIPREAQDAFALRSHRLAHAAHESGEFRGELATVVGHDEAGRRTRVERDQCVRADTSLAALAALAPAFQADGTVTAGNSSPRNDGASTLLVMSEKQAQRLGLRPLARVLSTAVTGVEPALMGLGPVSASELALRRAGLTLSDVDLVELNEAFAVQTLACLQQMGLDESRVNVRGGAIALGHPLGASGARIVTTLVHALRDRGAKIGLAALCVGLGQGMATVVEA